MTIDKSSSLSPSSSLSCLSSRSKKTRLTNASTPMFAKSTSSAWNDSQEEINPSELLVHVSEPLTNKHYQSTVMPQNISMCSILLGFCWFSQTSNQQVMAFTLAFFFRLPTCRYPYSSLRKRLEALNSRHLSISRSSPPGEEPGGLRLAISCQWRISPLAGS